MRVLGAKWIVLKEDDKFQLFELGSRSVVCSSMSDAGHFLEKERADPTRIWIAEEDNVVTPNENKEFFKALIPR